MLHGRIRGLGRRQRQGGSTNGNLLDPGRRLLGHQLRRHQVRRPVHTSHLGGSCPVLGGRPPHVRRAAHPGAGEQVGPERPALDGGPRLPRGAIGQTTFTFGVSLTSAANTGFIFATAPVWGLLFGFVLGLERPTWRGAAGVGLSILGIGVIFYEGLRLEGASLIGDLLVLLAAMGFGAYTVLSMRVLVRYSPLAVATYPILFGAPSCCWSPFRSSRDWSGRSSVWEHGPQSFSRQSSPRRLPSVPGRLASPVSGPTGS